MNLRPRLLIAAAALWWGSLTMTGFIVVPLLFANLPTPSMAGQMAAKLFTAQAWVGIACGVLLLMASRPRGEPARMDWADGALLFVMAGVLLALLVEFGVSPRIVARENLKLWHGLGTALYVLQWACAGTVLWKLSRSAGPS